MCGGGGHSNSWQLIPAFCVFECLNLRLLIFGLKTILPKDIGLADIWSTDIGPTDIWPADIGPIDILPTDVKLIDF